MKYNAPFTFLRRVATQIERYHFIPSLLVRCDKSAMWVVVGDDVRYRDEDRFEICMASHDVHDVEFEIN